jgi:hypothetical protein
MPTVNLQTTGPLQPRQEVETLIHAFTFTRWERVYGSLYWSALLTVLQLQVQSSRPSQGQRTEPQLRPTRTGQDRGGGSAPLVLNLFSLYKMPF